MMNFMTKKIRDYTLEDVIEARNNGYIVTYEDGKVKQIIMRRNK